MFAISLITAVLVFRCLSHIVEPRPAFGAGAGGQDSRTNAEQIPNNCRTAEASRGLARPLPAGLKGWCLSQGSPLSRRMLLRRRFNPLRLSTAARELLSVSTTSLWDANVTSSWTSRFQTGKCASHNRSEGGYIGTRQSCNTDFRGVIRPSYSSLCTSGRPSIPYPNNTFLMNCLRRRSAICGV